ncbi:MAG: ubiquitin-like protein Pup [Actinobacteria bacterium]|jgi:ubiquitin-like protein Pup|nr:ubiquitin-like protein Pup [Ilumatobacteraceae bacterium]MDA0299108.1 ubiquitin-like protein Pup [Actinomycetota bacterium]MDA2961265.1 ubiquitin-like protein Pup [Actinomycetota bacterium]MDA2994040.1 ubiquitin-like protein Pup [Actinomycetota bacterium]
MPDRIQRKKTERQSEEVAEAEVTPTESAAIDDIDDLLDEIDEILEENAEEFVRSYVQKGGE